MSALSLLGHLNVYVLQVVSHTKFGRHCMVACIVTNAAAGSDALENIMEEFNPSWLLW